MPEARERGAWPTTEDARCAALVEERLRAAKMQFERAIQSKHTAFDDLYPYMVENPSFFWYKRYVAWTELLVLVDLAGRLGLPWESLFLPHQVQFIRAQVLSGTVLDRWFDPAGEGEDR